MFSVVTNRYNNETWELNLNYRKKHNLKCIYAVSGCISRTIDLNTPVFVIEMNNSVDQIMGIGLIKNKPITEKKHKVQDDCNYNIYNYIGDYHITRETLENINPRLVIILDVILFKGKTHSKRGTKLTKIPEKVLSFEICQGLDIKKEIRNAFISYFKSNNLNK